MNEELDRIEYIWICSCGTLVESEMHCPNCHNQPPWSCSCKECQEMEDYWTDAEILEFEYSLENEDF